MKLFSSSSPSNSAIRGVFNPVVKGIVSPRRPVPPHIGAPEYHLSGRPYVSPKQVTLSHGKELQKIRDSARLARRMLDYACSLARPGITTDEIDRLTHEEIIRNEAYPSPVNYAGFPKAICTSVNEVCCHGIPDSRILEDGDIVSIDVSVFKDGYHGDNCKTVIVGDKCDERGRNLVSVTELALDRAIKQCGPGQDLTVVGSTIEETAKEHGFSVNREFMGHGVGFILHMSPLVAHYKNTNSFTLQKGMVFTIEPILMEGQRQIYTWEDGWTAVSADGGRSAQFEHEVLITDNGAEILTLP